MADDLYQAAGVPSHGTDIYEALGVGDRTGFGKTSASSRTNQFMGPGGLVSAPMLDFVHHVTGGLTDKEVALLQASGLVDGGVKAGGFGERYHGSLTNFRNDLAEWEGVSPKTADATKTAGFVAPMLLAGPEKGAQSLLEAGLQGAKAGVVAGGAFGFGGTDDSSISQDLAATMFGAGLGGGAGFALPAMSSMASAPIRGAARAVSAMRPANSDVVAGRILNEASGGRPLKFETVPITGMRPTLGQISNDPGLLWLGKAVSQGSPEAAALAKAGEAANNTAIRSTVAGLGDQSANASQSMSDALDAAYLKRKAANAAIWKQADVSNTGGVSGFQFNNFMKNYVGALSIPDQAAVPADVMATMEKMGAAKTQNLSDVQSMRSTLSGMATKAARAGDGNTARILGGMADQVENFIDLKAKNLGDKFPIYNQARADTRDMKQVFNTHPAVRKTLGVDSFGADKVPASATADQFLHNRKGAPEDLNAYLKAISSKDAQGKVTYDPVGFKAAQDAFGQKFLGSIANPGTDSAGNALVSPAKTAKFLTQYSHVINSPLFTPEQRNMIASIGRASQMTSRTAATGGAYGSDTYSKLSGDKFINALIGPGASKILNMAGTAGGAIAGYLHGGLTDAAIGAFGGEKGASAFSGLYSASREKAMALVTEAMHDPDLAKALMMKASNTNFKLIKPATRTKMLGILGADAAQPAVKSITAQ